MHPMYNHLGRSKRRKQKKSASLLKAKKEHQKYIEGLIKVKISSKPPPLKTDKKINTIKDEKSIDEYNWSPCLRKKRYTTTKTYTIAPAYNKGAYQVISKQHIKDIGK